MSFHSSCPNGPLGECAVGRDGGGFNWYVLPNRDAYTVVTTFPFSHPCSLDALVMRARLSSLFSSMLSLVDHIIFNK